MQRPVKSQQSNSSTEMERVYYLDWLRVIAILGVFVIHATCVFNDIDFHIKNNEQSSILTTFGAFVYPWGMPLVFLIAGAGSWFALQRRTPSQYAHERLNRLLIPFVVGSLLLSPIAYYFAWSNQVQMGMAHGSFLEFVNALVWYLNPRSFGVAGIHLWFLGFLFCYSLLTLPLFRWLKGQAGQRFISLVARVCDYPGGSLLFVLPLLIIRLGLQPVFPEYLNWTDFISFLSFYILGYLIFADKRFIQAIRRDWLITLTVGITAFLAAVVISIATDEFDLELVPRTSLHWVWWICFTLCSWCWIAFMLFVGVRFLNFSNNWLHYSREAVLPMYIFHLPVITVFAFFVVQWNAGILPKVLLLILASFLTTVGIYELLVKRVSLVRMVFGMKLRQPDCT